LVFIFLKEAFEVVKHLEVFPLGNNMVDPSRRTRAHETARRFDLAMN
jgi:hypothetical protein